MIPRSTLVLSRLKTAGTAPRQPDASRAACPEAGYPSWRDRMLTFVTTIQRFRLQVLHGQTAGRQGPPLAGLRGSVAAACHARAKRPRTHFGLL
jgi:hypothetical protein